MNAFNESSLWPKLQKLAEDIRLNPESTEANSAKLFKTHSSIALDFSRQKVNEAIMTSLVNLASEFKIEQKINDLMTGQRVNRSENKAALHTALRHLEAEPIMVDGINVMDAVLDAKDRMRVICESVRAKKWLGYSGEAIKSIVNVGIGGSDLGPRFCMSALSPYLAEEFDYHFISDVDPEGLSDVCDKINPETTLFIISSKSFTTKETLFNTNKLLQLYPSMQCMDKHFIAVTAYPDKAKALGFNTIVPIWDWVGGRYSFCSAINLITAIAIGYEQFCELLKGANSMDVHLRQAPLHDNIPVLMALLGLWNNNMLNIHQLVVLVYSKRLEYWVPYLQQLEMESNGKSIDLNGKSVNYATGPIVWGGMGNQAQHSYFQLLMQGTHRCAAEFITVGTHDQHLINFMADYKMRVLGRGVDSIDKPEGFIPGQMPINHLLLSDCSPYSLGALAALNEHKIYIQSVLWNINPFDQPGIESAKSMNLRAEQVQHFV